MKFLFIEFSLPYLLRDSEFPAGGWAVQLMAWLQALSKLGHQCGVLAWKGANDFVGSQSNCELLDTYDPAAGMRILKHAYVRLPALLATARAWKPDVVVQSIASLETGLMAFVGQRLGVPFVHRVASDAHVDERYRLLLKPHERLAYDFGIRRADLIMCQNQYQALNLKQRWPKARVRIQANIHQSPSNDTARPRDARAYVAWLGVFRQEKNLPLLYATAKQLPAVEFRVAGMEGSEIDGKTTESLALLRQLPNVRFVGYLNRCEVPNFLAGATSLLCTSHFEGFSNSFLEAFAAGTPVITRRGVDPDSIVAERGLGRVAARDEDLAACIAEIGILPAAEFHDLSQRCQFYLRNHHAPATLMQSFVEALAPLVAHSQVNS